MLSAVGFTLKRNDMDYRGFRIIDSEDSGGKAGSGCNKTTSVQVRGDEFFRYVRYNVGEKGARAKAIEKAKGVVDKEIERLKGK